MKMPGKLTDLVKLIVLVCLIKATPVISNKNSTKGLSDQEKACVGLAEIYKKTGFIPLKRRNEYCLNGCDFLNVSCKPSNASGYNFPQLTQWVELVTKVLDGEYDDFEERILYPHDDTIDAWTQIFSFSWPILLSVIPILLNQWKVYNYWGAVLLIIAFIIIHLCGIAPLAISIHNMLLALLALMHSANAGYLIESVWTVSFMYLITFSIFMVTPIFQAGIVFVSIIAYIGYLRWCFMVRRPGASAGIVVVVSQVLVMVEQLKFIRRELADISLGGASIEMILNSVLPDGKSSYFFINIMAISKCIVKRLVLSYHPIITFTFFLLLQICLFLVFRGCLGAFYIFSLRYKSEPKTVLLGAYVYAVDFFGPFRCVFRILFRYEPFVSRRVFYAAVGLLMTYFEYRSAVEMLFIRLIMSLLEAVFFQSHYYRVTHYLELNVDFMNVAFPHDNSLPWASLSQLSDIGKYTGRVVADLRDRIVSGTGVVLVSGGRPMLYCVKHVVNGCKLVQFKSDAVEHTVSTPEFTSISSNETDPMMSMKVEIEGAPHVELITPDEVFDVKYLVFINSAKYEDEHYEAYVCIAKDFSINRGTLKASVNLKCGDSGGPCFAVLEDGTIRLCGVVSQGNPRNGGGNLISFMYHSMDLSCDSSEDGKDINVTKFNAARRVRFRGEDVGQRYFEDSFSLKRYLTEHKDVFDGLAKHKHRLSFEDIDADTNALAGRWIESDILNEERNEDENDEQKAERTKANRKRRQKDRAAYKRQISVLKNVVPHLSNLYAKEDMCNIFNQFSKGNIPEMMEREIIVKCEDGMWIIQDIDEPTTRWEYLPVKYGGKG